MAAPNTIITTHPEALQDHTGLHILYVHEVREWHLLENILQFALIQRNKELFPLLF